MNADRALHSSLSGISPILNIRTHYLSAKAFSKPGFLEITMKALKIFKFFKFPEYFTREGEMWLTF